MTDIVNLTEWHRWFKKFVEPIYSDNASMHEAYYEYIGKIQAPFYPNHQIAQEFYKKIEEDNRFDRETKMFFAFLYSCGFFKENTLDFEKWLSMKNWLNPKSDLPEKSNILEILDKENGPSLLKQQLRWIPFLDRPDGH